jgi:RHS repeat-associated protein
VFFDNLTVQHYTGPLTEEAGYYPFGLKMAGLSNKAHGRMGSRKLYNGNELQEKEFSDGCGLNFYDFNARGYDQQLGRFMQIDPMADEEEQESWTPYHFAYNNPVRFSDPDGRHPIVFALAVWGWRAYRAYRAVQTIKKVVDNAKTPVVANSVAGSTTATPTGLSLTLPGTPSNVLKPGSLLRTGSAQGKQGTFNGKQDTESKTSREAFRKAKEQNGVPRSQQPEKVTKPNTPAGDKAGLDSRNVRQHEYTNSNGQKVVIRQDKAAKYSDGGSQPPHYNAGQNPTVPKDLKQHHNYQPNSKQ